MGNGNPCPEELGSWAPTERNLQSRPRFFVSGQYEVGRAWNEEMIGPTNTLDRQTNKTAHQISSIILTIVCENAGQEAQKNRGKTATCPSCRGRNKPFGGQPGPDRFPVVPGRPVGSNGPVWASHWNWRGHCWRRHWAVGLLGPFPLSQGARHRHHTPRPPCPFSPRSSVVGVTASIGLDQAECPWLIARACAVQLSSSLCSTVMNKDGHL